MQLYIHIPFCRKKCRYCSFSSYTGREDFYEKYISFVLTEAVKRIKEVHEPFHTAYIGGGTPSLLPPDLLEKLLTGLKEIYRFECLEEFTTEANPGTVTREWLNTACRCGINRISFGMQAYQNHLLQLLGRIHTFEDVSNSVCMAREAGIHNINVDLIFGIPNQRKEEWSETLDAAVSLKPQHISTYGLIPEDGTPLYRDLENGILSLPDPEEEREMYDTAIVKLASSGLHQYEISNFAVSGCECRHNIGYWTQIPYIGLGTAASSFTGVSFDAQRMSGFRKTNPNTLEAYADWVKSGCSLQDAEWISPQESRFETLMLGLRMNRGISESAFEKMHRISLEYCYGSKLHSLEKSGLMIHENDTWRLSRRGFDIQNSILVELME